MIPAAERKSAAVASGSRAAGLLTARTATAHHTTNNLNQGQQQAASTSPSHQSVFSLSFRPRTDLHNFYCVTYFTSACTADQQVLACLYL